MLRTHRAATVRRAVAGWRRRRRRVAFVPTLGAIHAGHLSLVARARRTADRVVASVFVNPLQFGPHEDFRRYPRPARRDRALLRAAGVDLLWEPRAVDLYPAGHRTRVHVEQGWGRQPWGSSPWTGERVSTYFAFDNLNRQQSVFGPLSAT